MPDHTRLPPETFSSVAPLTIRVYYEDTDAAGVVFYANYLKYFERARTEWLRSLGIEQSELIANENLMFIVRNVSARYIAPARLDDEVLIETQVKQVGAASVQFEQTALRDNEPLCTSQIEVCCINAQTFLPTRLPDHLRSLFKKVQN